MKLFVYDPNTSKNNSEFFESFVIIKNWQKKYKKPSFDGLILTRLVSKNPKIEEFFL